MAVQLVTDVTTTAPDVACPCADRAPCFGRAFELETAGAPLTDEMRTELRAHAWVACCHCKGEGTCPGYYTPGDWIEIPGWALPMFGLTELEGELPIPHVRRALLLAKNRDHARFECPETIVHGPPRTREDGAIELRPVRMWSSGVDGERIAGILDRVEAFVDRAVTRGATVVRWS